MNIADGLQQPRGRGALEQVAAGAGLEGIKQRIAVLIDGQHQELDAGHGALQLAHAFHALDAGQIDVHEHHVGRMPRDFLQGRLRVRVIAGQFQGGCAADQCRQTRADALIVIHDGNFDLHVLGDGGDHTLL